MPNKNVKKGGKVGKALAVGAGVAAAGAAAYMLLGPNGKKNRAKVKAFTKKIKNKAMNNKEVMAVAAMAAKAMSGAKSKAKGAVKKAKSVATKAVKKGVSSAKSGAKKVVGTAKKAAKKVVGTAKKAVK